MLQTAFTSLVGCSVPIQQAGMGGAATPELAAAVSGAGGLGMVSLPMVPAEEVAVTVAALAKGTTGHCRGTRRHTPRCSPTSWTSCAEGRRPPETSSCRRRRRCSARAS